jgi:serine-type D-Ala-D-Ala carboxypeptidase/endopeptidase
MATTVAPTQAQLAKLVAPYLATIPSGVGFAIGYASPNLPGNGGLYFAGNVRNQFGSVFPLDESTPFAIAGVSKTFTATACRRTAMMTRSIRRPTGRTRIRCRPC